MKRLVEGEDRRPTALQPASIEDCGLAGNPVRVIGAFAARLDPAEPGFKGAVPEPPAGPATARQRRTRSTSMAT